MRSGGVGTEEKVFLQEEMVNTGLMRISSIFADT